ncbi:MAG: hypothetical protein ACKVWV_13630 [Planctomycetota bacterium]
MKRLALVVGVGFSAWIAWAWLAADSQRAVHSDDAVGAIAATAPTPATSLEPSARMLDAALPPAPPRSHAAEVRGEELITKSRPNPTKRGFQVVDGRTGEPLAALVLRARSRSFALEVTTDADGGFDIAHPELPPGFVELEVIDRDRAQPVSRLLHPSTIHPARASHGLSGTLTIRAFARAPAIEVEVRDGHGARAPGATVWLHDAEEPDRASRSDAPPLALPLRDHTDAHGLARFSTFRAEADAASVAFVDDEHGAVSAPVVVHHSARSTLPVLRIEPAGTLRIRILGARGRPLEDFEVTAALVVDPYAPLPLWTETAARGVVASRPLPPGAYRVRVRHASGAPELVTYVDVHSAAETPVEFSFQEDLPERAVSGIVFDEAGAPLANVPLELFPRDGSNAWSYSRSDGTFEVWRMRRARVALVVGVDGMSDAFEPALLEADFGSENVIVRRTAVLPYSHVPIRPVDARTGAVLLDARLLLIRDDADLVVATFAVAGRWRGLPSNRETVATDTLFVDAKLLPSMRWRLFAPGYEQRDGSVADWTAMRNGEAPIEIALKPGFEASVRVVDRETREPLDGVRCLDSRDFAVVTFSDERGVVALRGIVPPVGGFLLEHPDYLTGAWDPLTRWSESGVIELWPRTKR